MSRGALTFILTRGIGQSFIARDVPASEVLVLPEGESSGMMRGRLDRRWRSWRACPGPAGLARPPARRLRLRTVALTPQRSGHDELRGAVDELHRDGQRGQAGPRPGRRPARPARARSLRRHGPPHQHALGQCRRSRPRRWCAKCCRARYTRMPLWRGSIDNIVGVVHAKDLLRALERGRQRLLARST